MSNKQPTSLYIFFSTEMWERYGFYVIQSLLALYLSLDYGFSDDKTYAIVGSFTALTYISPIIGGWIADKLLGQKTSIMLGAIVLMTSYVFLSIDDTLLGLVSALASVSVGTGLLKPNISSLLGNLYEPGDLRRDSGFTIFYMGITSGIILGTTLPSKLVQLYGWPASFTSAAIGLFLALIIFAWGVKRYSIEDYIPKKTVPSHYLWSAALLAGLWILAFAILKYATIADIIFTIVTLSAIGYVYYVSKQEGGSQGRKTLSILFLCLISILFWTFYFQMFSSLTLFINRLVVPTVLGIKFSPPYYVTVQSIGMLVFGYFIMKLWRKIGVKNVAYSTAVKFFIAMCTMLIAYGLILLSIITTPSIQLIFPALILCAYLMISVAELLLSPVGLSSITQLAHSNRVSTMMGIFFVSLGVGGYCSGALAQITAMNDSHASIAALKANYYHGFLILTGLLLVSTLFSGFMVLVIKKLTETKTTLEIPVDNSEEALSVQF